MKGCYLEIGVLFTHSLQSIGTVVIGTNTMEEMKCNIDYLSESGI